MLPILQNGSEPEIRNIFGAPMFVTRWRKNYVMKGEIIVCNYHLHRYKVSFVHPNVNRSLRSSKWVPVSNITSITRAEEMKRRKATLAALQQANARKKYHLPNEHKVRLTFLNLRVSNWTLPQMETANLKPLTIYLEALASFDR